jgi:hypothetical protein
MEKIYVLDQMHKLELEDDGFEVKSKDNDKLKSTGALIVDYVNSSINNFNDEFPGKSDGRGFIFISDDCSPLDSFLEAKNKIELLSYKSNNENELNFVIDFLKYIKHTETELVLSMKTKKNSHFTYTYEHGDLNLIFTLYPDSWLKSFELKYKGNSLIEVSDYMLLGVKVIEHVDFIFSLWDTRMNGNEYSDAIEWLYRLENYVMDNM